MKNNLDAQNKNKKSTWKQDPESVKANILDVARKEFVTEGLSGSSINVIAQKSDTSKRMIYYYFKDKEGLYKATLEATYQSIRNAENNLDVDNLKATEALEELVEFTVNHHNNNPDFIRFIMIENIHHAKYLESSEIIRELNKPAIKRIEDIYNRGVEEGVFKEGLNPIEIHWQISALSFFKIANKYTFNVAFNYDSCNEKNHCNLINLIKQSVLQYVLK
jgi:AcrR family transcriptional regulator